MRVRVLGSGAGGGFPQWNCACPNCRGLRAGTLRARARTQDSIAVSADGDGWVVVNASPDIRAQIESFDALHPRAPRDTPVRAIVLTNGDLDHTLGLFSLRESQPLCVFATEAVRRGLVEKNAIARTLERFAGQVTWRDLRLGAETDLVGVGGAPTGLTVTAFALPGKPPVHLMGASAPSAEDNVGLVLREARTGRTLVYAAAARMPGDARAIFDAADALFYDGTFWTEDELVTLGLGAARAKDMAHQPIDGPDGSLTTLAACAARRKIFTHINNTNPILNEDSPERRIVEDAGWEIAFDGMEITL